jgi:hypothetical protein
MRSSKNGLHDITIHVAGRAFVAVASTPFVNLETMTIVHFAIPTEAKQLEI